MTAQAPNPLAGNQQPARSWQIGTPDNAVDISIVDPFLESVVSGPLVVATDFFQSYVSNIRNAMSVSGFMQGFEPETRDGFWDDSRYMTRYYRPYDVSDGVLRIPVRGSLMNDLTYSLGNWATGHVYLRKAVERGMNDPMVTAIAFDINSPGGEAAGMPELSSFIASARGEKPMRSFVNGNALSGAYWFASATDGISVTPSGHTGSVGVINVHGSIARALDKDGIDVTIIQAGKHKAEGSSLRQLSGEARNNIQRGVDKIYEHFAGAVSANRGMDEKEVRDTEARVFDSEDSIDVGFADEVAEYESGFAEFTAEHGVKSMPQANANRRSEANEPNSEISQAALDSARVEAAAEARTSERKRFADVQAHDEYKGREALASKLLSDSDMTSEQIIGVLAAAERKVDEPKAQEGEANAFEAAMNKSGKPDVKAEEDDPEGNAFDTDAVFACLGQPTLKEFQGGVH